MAGYGVGSDAHIKVQTEALIERAENAKSAISTMENRLNEISQKVNQMSGYWEGEAADRAKNLYQKRRKQCRKFFRS